jgi:hypothetical protein
MTQLIENEVMTEIPWERHESEKAYQAAFSTKSGKFIVSVIGGDHHYCEPACDVSDPKIYSEVELLLLDPLEDSGESASFEDLDIDHIYDVIGDYFDGNQLFTNVPVEKVMELYKNC